MLCRDKIFNGKDYPGKTNEMANCQHLFSIDTEAQLGDIDMCSNVFVTDKMEVYDSRTSMTNSIVKLPAELKRRGPLHAH